MEKIAPLCHVFLQGSILRLASLLSREEGFAVTINCQLLLMGHGHLHFGYVTTNAVSVKCA